MIGNGFDHCFALAERDAAAPAATLHDPAGGRLLEIFTTEPGIQLYTANGFDGSLTDSEGRPFVRNQALALETQHFPNSPNRPDYLLHPAAPRRDLALRDPPALRLTWLAVPGSRRPDRRRCGR